MKAALTLTPTQGNSLKYENMSAIAPLIDQRCSLNDVPTAIRWLEQRQVLEKVVICV
jgi:hypothetical protein